MEDNGDERSRSSLSAPGRDWFSRATSLLQETLEEWKQRHHARNGSPASLPAHGASPGQVAEAVLNSVHCCIAALATSMSAAREAGPCSSVSGSTDEPRRRLDSDQGEAEPTEGADQGASHGVKGMLKLQDLPVAKAFQRIGEVVTLAAGIDLVGKALFRRCSSLLAKPKE